MFLSFSSSIHSKRPKPGCLMVKPILQSVVEFPFKLNATILARTKSVSSRDLLDSFASRAPRLTS